MILKAHHESLTLKKSSVIQTGFHALRAGILVHLVVVKVHKKEISTKQENCGESMANRNKNFDETVAKKMQNFEFSQSFILALINDHELPIQDALIESIEAIGLSEFAEKCGYSIQYVSDFVNRRKDYKVEVIDKFLQPFGLKIKLDVEKVT